MRFLIECTYVYEHPQDNSGIQRVVRNIIRQLACQQPVECIPVMMNGGQLYRVLSLAPLAVDRSANIRQVLIIKLEHMRNRYWGWHSRLERLWPFRKSIMARRMLYWPSKLLSLSIILPLSGLFWLNRNAEPAPQRSVLLDPMPGDKLILLDSSWHADFFTLAEKLKNQGISIISVIYDLIPLTHPQFCDAGLVKVFDNWFSWIAKTADGYMAISNTISMQVDTEIKRRLGPAASQRWHGHFHLGSELDLLRDTSRINTDLQNMFRDSAPVYLMVSTIEPRKNHSYLLDAFDLLWAQGLNVRLCIIGKIGWKCDDVVTRINKHPQLGKRLFMFNRINDAGLEFSYRSSRALIFPSHVEGFGLPLVEAMQRGLPAMASDIPVFREVGGDFMAYFDLAEPQSLANHVAQFEATGQFPALLPLAGWRWIDWHEASQQLINGTLEGLERGAKQSARAVHADLH